LAQTCNAPGCANPDCVAQSRTRGDMAGFNPAPRWQCRDVPGAMTRRT
jgi:hypothetical protein